MRCTLFVMALGREGGRIFPQGLQLSIFLQSAMHWIYLESCYLFFLHFIFLYYRWGARAMFEHRAHIHEFLLSLAAGFLRRFNLIYFWVAFWL